MHTTNCSRPSCNKEINPHMLIPVYLDKENKNKVYICPQCHTEYASIVNKHIAMQQTAIDKWFNKI